MRTDQLIHELVQSNHPVRTLDPPWIRSIRWFIPSLVWMTVGVGFYGARSDWRIALESASFLYPFLSTLALSFFSALSALILSIPGRRLKWINAIPFATSMGWVGVLISAIYLSGSQPLKYAAFCINGLMMLSALPVLLLLNMLRRGAPLRLDGVSLLAALGGSSIGSLGVQLICRSHDPLHILLWHHLPVILLGLIGFLAGKISEPLIGPKDT